MENVFVFEQNEYDSICYKTQYPGVSTVPFYFRSDNQEMRMEKSLERERRLTEASNSRDASPMGRSKYLRLVLGC